MLFRSEGVSIIKWPLTKQKTPAGKKWVVDAAKMVWVADFDSEPRKERGHWRLHDGSVQDGSVKFLH